MRFTLMTSDEGRVEKQGAFHFSNFVPAVVVDGRRVYVHRKVGSEGDQVYVEAIGHFLDQES